MITNDYVRHTNIYTKTNISEATCDIYIYITHLFEKLKVNYLLSQLQKIKTTHFFGNMSNLLKDNTPEGRYPHASILEIPTVKICQMF